MQLFSIQKLPFLAALLLVCNSFFAQNGPGGIEDTSGTSNLFLWLDATKIEGVSNLNTVTTWNDVSGYNHDVTAPNAATKPHLRTNILNGHQVLSFDGNSNHMDGSFGGSFGSPSTIIVVPYYDDINQANSENGYVISIGSGNGTRAHYSIGRRNSGGGDGNKYYAWINDGSPKLGDTIVGQSWNIISQLSSSSSPFHSMYLNGTASTSLTDYSGTISTDGIFRIGQWYNGGTNRLDGRLAEVIVYNKTLNTLELNIVQSYLSAKYDISISNDQYTGDDPANGDNDMDVVGLGVLSTDSSKTVESSGLQLEISQDFDDGDYVMLGHNVSENSINSVDVNGSIHSRWDRAWWLDITNTGNTVNCNFVFSLINGDIGYGGLDHDNVSNYKLIHRTGTSGSWSIIASASGLTAHTIIFNDIDINTDGYYTVATIDANSALGVSPTASGSDGPAGIGGIDGTTSLKLWYNVGDQSGQDGDEILSIVDQSGNGNDVSQLTIINIPELDSGAVNGKAALSFNGSNGYLDGTMNFNFTPPLTVFTVAYFNNLNQANDDNDYIYSAGSGLSRGDQMSLSRRKANDEDDVANINKYYSWDGDTARFGDVISGQTWYAFTQEYRATGASILHNASFNGTDANVDDNEVEVNTNNNTLSIGRWNGNNHWLDGLFSELIIYDRNLNSAEINIIQSYLGGKYNITVNNDKYSGDDPANGDFDLNIAGVGTESDGSNTSANSAGLLIDLVSGFANGDYAVFGHAIETNAVRTTDATDDLGTNDARWDRNWFVDTTNTGDDLVVNITFDFSDVEADGFPGSNVDYSLLYRSGTSGTWTNQNINAVSNGDQVVFNNVTLSEGYYTLGTSSIVNSPLPVTLTKFTAFKLLDHAKINWRTESEINNDYFLLERSEDNKNYILIDRIQGYGNSINHHTYAVNDYSINPRQTYYYKLTQFDYDGQAETFGPIELKSHSKENNINIYPNPCNDLITLSGLPEKCLIKLLSQSGEIVYKRQNLLEETITVDVSDINKGVYFLQLTSLEENIIQLIVVQ